jgi:succinate dehydrogenase / fumarate reductase, flavoprotein subunit
MGRSSLPSEAGESGQQAQVHRHRGGLRPGRRIRRGHAGELGYNVKCFCFQDSPRRAHSIAAQGGINAAKNYHNDGDSVYRLFYDTVKGGDFRARESNVYRLAPSASTSSISASPRACRSRANTRAISNRSFGGAQVSRTFYARGQTGQQLLLGAIRRWKRQIGAGSVRCTRAPKCSTSS